MHLEKKTFKMVAVRLKPQSHKVSVKGGKTRFTSTSTLPSRPDTQEVSDDHHQHRHRASIERSGHAAAALLARPVDWLLRDGSCRTDALDGGIHLVCARVTSAFLEFTLIRGNDLLTPRPQSRFPGLRPGDN